MVESTTLIAALLDDSSFQPLEAENLEQAGLSEALVESLICKHLHVLGKATGRGLSEELCLPFRVLEGRFQKLKSRHWLAHTGAAPLNDYVYMLTDQGREQAQLFAAICAYRGPAPVPLSPSAAIASAFDGSYFRTMPQCRFASVGSFWEVHHWASSRCFAGSPVRRSRVKATSAPTSPSAGSAPRNPHPAASSDTGA